MIIDDITRAATLPHIELIAYLGDHAAKSPYYAARVTWAPREMQWQKCNGIFNSTPLTLDQFPRLTKEMQLHFFGA
jgi:hypothetical protein